MAHAVPDPPIYTNTVEFWNTYEDVAMHFNDLIMRWQLQAIGGLAVLVTLAGFVVGDAATLCVRYRAMLILSAVLTFAWVALASLTSSTTGVSCKVPSKRFWQSSATTLVSLISTAIENEAASASTVTPWMFYVWGLIPLPAIMAWAIIQLFGLPPEMNGDLIEEWRTVIDICERPDVGGNLLDVVATNANSTTFVGG